VLFAQIDRCTAGTCCQTPESQVIIASFLLSKASLQNTDKDHVTGTGILPNYAPGISSLFNLQPSKLAEYKSSKTFLCSE